eukprot:TRINITY_DN1459_c0_g1_i2.p1 TRINITY_DN1459_c0_g1~~TRINITY_DN1459_c0_g1_i2.p1  ORF type:complete len:137 (+),score=24.11 TRINITY_DN1459_c0_g1_i2:326-736(+)
MKTNFIMNNPIHRTKGGKQTLPQFIEVSTFGFTWGRFNHKIVSHKPVDIILGADIFYDNSEVFDDILATVDFFFKQNPTCKFITTYQNRSSNRSLDFLLLKWSMKVECVVPNNTFLPPNKYKDTESVQLLIITKKL